MNQTVIKLQGPQGCGKTTTIQKLSPVLTAAGFPVKVVQENEMMRIETILKTTSESARPHAVTIVEQLADEVGYEICQKSSPEDDMVKSIVMPFIGEFSSSIEEQQNRSAEHNPTHGGFA